MIQTLPYKIHKILTDNRIQFAEQPRNRNTIYSRPMRFDMIGKANGIEHCLTKPNHHWTNGQVEQMNRTIKNATIKRYHYDSHDQLLVHLTDFLAAYNFARRLKTLNGLTPDKYICKIWTSVPDRFILDPIHQMPRLNTPPGAPFRGPARDGGKSVAGVNDQRDRRRSDNRAVETAEGRGDPRPNQQQAILKNPEQSVLNILIEYRFGPIIARS